VGSQKKLRKLKQEITFLKKQGTGILDKNLEWTQQVSPMQLLASLNYEKTLNQTFILLLLTFHIPTFQPYLSIIMSLFVIGQAVITFQFFRKLKASKLAEKS